MPAAPAPSPPASGSAAGAAAAVPAVAGRAGRGASCGAHAAATCSGSAHHQGEEEGGGGRHESAGSRKRVAGRSVINLSARAGGSAHGTPWCSRHAGAADGRSPPEGSQAEGAKEGVPGLRSPGACAVPGDRNADDRGRRLGSAQGPNCSGQDKVSRDLCLLHFVYSTESATAVLAVSC